MQVLTDAELDAVSGGQARATLNLANLLATGAPSATADAADVNVVAVTVGGLAPSNTAFVSGTFTATSSSEAAETDG